MSPALLVLALAFAAGTLAANRPDAPVYAGCISSSYSDPTAVDISSPAIGTAAQCGSACFSLSYYDIFSLYVTQTGQCLCSTNAPGLSQYTSGTDHSGTCQTTDYTYFVTQSRYQFEGCGTGFPGGAGQGIQPNVEACMQACPGRTWISFGALETAPPTTGTSGSGNCYCGASWSGGGSYTTPSSPYTYATCSGNSWQQYWNGVDSAGNSPAATVGGASNWARRQLKERLERTATETIAHCPAPLEACRVPGDHLAFECIDTASDSESCGGCNYGSFNNATSALGLDCTSAPGVSSGGAFCNQGQCSIHSCRGGWRLHQNKCIRK